MKRSNLGLISSVLVALSAAAVGTVPTIAAASAAHYHLDCFQGRFACTEVSSSEAVFGEGRYVGHDEPSTLFYSTRAGSGNQDQWQLMLPKDPPPTPIPGRSFNFQLHPAFWFGMALCDTQSAPHPMTIHACPADSDTNITTDANIANHAGAAFMEMQFYPPGWVPWPDGNSCAATKWCAALNIDSLSIDYPEGKFQNPTCQSMVGIEPVNFAFITRTGVPQAPPNPVQSTLATFTPNPALDLFMNSGDRIVVSMKDTAHGLRIDIADLTTGQAGLMVASAANNFGQVKFAPSPSTACMNIPYDFHPMYSTSSENTRVPWTAHSYNIAFADEIGHFDACAATAGRNNNCLTTGTEGTDGERSEGGPPPGTFDPKHDDSFCHTAAESTLVKTNGCQGTNSGFDGVPYQPVWPDGNTTLHPTTILFTSPKTGTHNYERMGFEADLPRIERADTSTAGTCNPMTGAGCTLIPLTDDLSPTAKPVPARFYPWFTVATSRLGCAWTLGNDIPGVTSNDFGKNAQYGTLLALTYPATGGHGATVKIYEDFRQVRANPCPASLADIAS